MIAISERIVSQISGSPQITGGTDLHDEHLVKATYRLAYLVALPGAGSQQGVSRSVAASHPEELPGTAAGPACRWCWSSTMMRRVVSSW